MTRPEDRVRIQHALDAARKAVAGTEGWSRNDLDLDELETLGLVRLLEIIGEAASAVSRETASAHPQIPWRKMIGLRNRLIHGYFNVNLDILWDTVQKDLPDLIPLLEKMLGEKE
jgi:uncharacterized protein with HEPN domain